MYVCIHMYVCMYIYCSLFITFIVGASYIKTMLINNSKLQYLNIGKNAIGNDGIKCITEGLQHNKTLIKLKANQCSFSVEGICVTM